MRARGDPRLALPALRRVLRSEAISQAHVGAKKAARAMADFAGRLWVCLRPPGSRYYMPTVPLDAIAAQARYQRGGMAAVTRDYGLPFGFTAPGGDTRGLVLYVEVSPFDDLPLTTGGASGAVAGREAARALRIHRWAARQDFAEHFHALEWAQTLHRPSTPQIGSQRLCIRE